VQLALLLDASNSMDGDRQAKTQLWSIVNAHSVMPGWQNSLRGVLSE
jgi:hypothetical protein